MGWNVDLFTRLVGHGKAEEIIEQLGRWTAAWSVAADLNMASMVAQVKWQPPKDSWVKLNVDGYSVDNPSLAGAGGVIRNSQGGFIGGFAVSLGHHSNNYAEVMGLLHGLRLIDSLGLTNVEIELDSMLVIHWLKRKRCGLWYMEDFWEEILRRLDKLNISYSHSFREINVATDGLAKRGAQGIIGACSTRSRSSTRSSAPRIGVGQTPPSSKLNPKEIPTNRHRTPASSKLIPKIGLETIMLWEFYGTYGLMMIVNSRKWHKWHLINIGQR
ncbi:uncharacterized protein LOC118349850 [Juglans regia]|uniref:Uncharacterized protein LOC118349850 n=1 Tax=Juglans regia TaxID=51240 RepID=A0A6P9EV81_JUGRE|nr:uncharacterized protein LOC118349850 [Juglans regia]